ncbi:hypothetical protein [Oceanobacillus massiliensis]|uniref:hypothetical protein n=1 Tax=Oceanobacillus massiliensis TaxID=1465765 RepID=UPI0011CB6CAB|nr:hypothetical protein [Oceanobacillus massiliensis]
MDSTLPVSNDEKVSSPFTNINEQYSLDDVEKGKTFTYSTAYDVKIGPLKGSLTGSIIFGDSNKAVWDLDANSAINRSIEKSIIKCICQRKNRVNRY